MNFQFLTNFNVGIRVQLKASILMVDDIMRYSTEKWRPRIVLSLALVLTAGCGTPPSPQEFKTQLINFDSYESGKLPPDFRTELTGGGGPVSWAVRDDANAPGGKKILVQESTDDTSYRFPLCIYEKAVVRDAAVEVKYKAISGKVDQAGGIILRYNPENYYIARANALEDNIDLFKTVNGKRLKIEEAPIKVTGGEWHTLRFEAKTRSRGAA